MKINDIYIGGWFQRTMLQLTEIYDFVRFGESRLNLDSKKLKKLRENLDIKTIDYGTDGLEYVSFDTLSGINVKIVEDGLIILNDKNVTEETLFDDINSLANYYEKKLSPALNYIFSLGAPVPKELAGIKTVFPYFVVFDKAKKEDISKLLNGIDREKYYSVSDDCVDILRGDKYYFINKKNNKRNISAFVEEQIFIREFKGQLHRYLNLHRIIWERIDEVKENANVKGSDIIKFTTKLEGYSKTITLIDGRIRQMSTYISTREKIAKSDQDLTDFLATFGYRYETLKDTLDYIKSLWDMTKNYVSSAQKLFDSLKGDVQNKSINSLTLVTSMSAGVSIISLLTKTEPEFSAFGIWYFFILAIIVLAFNKGLNLLSKNRKYKISDIEYDKDIK